MIQIEQLKEATDGVVAALDRLIPQLSSRLPCPSKTDLEAVLACPCTQVFAAWCDDEIVGTLVLVSYRTLTGELHSVIEGVVVDKAFRSRGIGEALVRQAQAAVREAGGRGALLTCAPSREAANRLYRRLGFHQVPTNVFLWLESAGNEIAECDIIETH